jgi:hypothetical protein
LPGIIHISPAPEVNVLEKYPGKSNITGLLHNFCCKASMFLSTPTVEELIQSDLHDLVDMLAKHTVDYTRQFKKEGINPNTAATKEMIIKIQKAIDVKMSEKKQA